VTLINPIFSEWKSVGLELTIPMMYHTLLVTTKCLKSFLWCGGKVIIMSALSLSLRDKDRLRELDNLVETITNGISFTHYYFL